MAEEHSIGSRPLKRVALSDLEDAIAATVSELAGARYSAVLRHLDLVPAGASDLVDSYELTVWVNRIIAKPEHEVSKASSVPATRQSERPDVGAEDRPATRQPTLAGLTGRQLNHE